MIKNYYSKLHDTGDNKRISQIEEFIDGTRLPHSMKLLIYNFLYFGEGEVADYADHAALDELHPKLEKEARRRHNLSDKEKILYYRKRKDNVTIVITDYGYSYKNDTDTPYWGEAYFYIPWESINRVEYDESIAKFEFFSSSSKIAFDTYNPYSIVKTENEEKCKLFAELLTTIAKCFYRDREIYKKALTDNAIPFSDKMEKCDLWLKYCVEYEECLDALFSKVDLYLAEYNANPNNSFLESSEAVLDDIITYDESKFNSHNHWFDIKPKWSKMEHRLTVEENEATQNRIRFYMAKIASLKGNLQEARQNIIRILGTDNYDDRRTLIKTLDDLESKESWQSYTTNISYQKRKLIMPLRDISGCNSRDIEVFRMDHIPSCILFPKGHPIQGTIYIGNPIVPNMYIPYEGYEFEFFKTKVYEYCRLLQCLGATEVSIKTIRGRSASEATSSANHTDGTLGVKAFSASAEQTTNAEKKRETSSSSELEIVQRFDPKQKPYVPDDLIWYKEQSDWQSKVQQRLTGNMLEFSQRMSTKETTFVSSAEAADIKAQAEFLWAKANINYNERTQSEFKVAEETEWLVSVKFKSLDEFENEDSTQKKATQEMPDNERKYKEEVLFYLEDNGVITDIERRFLDKKRIRLGVSDERAREIEESCMPQLTDAEREYVDALKDLGDADIHNPRIRRMLEHEREELGISEERAKEFEQQYIHS